MPLLCGDQLSAERCEVVTLGLVRGDHSEATVEPAMIVSIHSPAVAHSQSAIVMYGSSGQMKWRLSNYRVNAVLRAWYSKEFSTALI